MFSGTRDTRGPRGPFEPPLTRRVGSWKILLPVVKLPDLHLLPPTPIFWGMKDTADKESILESLESIQVVVRPRTGTLRTTEPVNEPFVSRTISRRSGVLPSPSHQSYPTRVPKRRPPCYSRRSLYSPTTPSLLVGPDITTLFFSYFVCLFFFWRTKVHLYGCILILLLSQRVSSYCTRGSSRSELKFRDKVEGERHTETLSNKLRTS